MYPVDYKHGAIKHAYPQDQIRRPPVGGHVAYEAINSEVVRLVFGWLKHGAALAIYRK